MEVTLEVAFERRVWPLSLLFQGGPGAAVPLGPILRDVDGSAAPGETLAIMGPSGTDSPGQTHARSVPPPPSSPARPRALPLP